MEGRGCSQFRYLVKRPCLRIGFLSSIFGLEIRKFDTCPLIDVLDRMIWMLQKPHMPKDSEAGSLIGRKMKKQKKESYKIATNGSKRLCNN